MSRTPKAERVGRGARHKGIPRRPVGKVGDQLGDNGPVDRWFCRRSPDCRRHGCASARRWARIRAARLAYRARRSA